MIKYIYEGIHGKDIHAKLFELSDVILAGIKRLVFDYNASTGTFILVGDFNPEICEDLEFYFMSNFGEIPEVKENI